MSIEDMLVKNIVLPGKKSVLKGDGSGIDINYDCDEMRIEVTPTEGYVIKTWSTQQHPKASCNKVFINICSSDKIKEPSQQTKLDEQGNEVGGMNVPVCVGPLRWCKTKTGETSVVLDCIAHTSVVDNRQQFISMLAIQYAQQKYKNNFGSLQENSFRILKNMKYQYGYDDDHFETMISTGGDDKSAVKKQVAKQWIKDTSKSPTIQVMDNNSETFLPSSFSSFKKNDNIKPLKIHTKFYIQDSKSTYHSLLFGSSSSLEYCSTNTIASSLLQQEEEFLPPFPIKQDVLDYTRQCGIIANSKIDDNSNDDKPQNLCLRIQIVPDVSKDDALQIAPTFTTTMMDLNISAFLCILTWQDRKAEVILPFPIKSKGATSYYEEASMTLHVQAPLSFKRCIDYPDEGTEQWALTRALKESVTCSPNDPAKESNNKKSISESPSQQVASIDHESAYYEKSIYEKFHLKPPLHRSKKSSKIYQAGENCCGTDLVRTGKLPEDKFHQNDILSQHMLELQREEQLSKIGKVEEGKRLQQQNTGDVEHIDFNKFLKAAKKSPLDSTSALHHTKIKAPQIPGFQSTTLSV